MLLCFLCQCHEQPLILLAELREMGFTDEAANVSALDAANGDVADAVGRLTG